ncbi:MAG: hypothetical protein WCJ74_00075 [bacterium]
MNIKDPTPNTLSNPVVKIETTKPNWIEKFVIDTREVTHEGKTYSYLVVNEEEFGKKVSIPKTFASYSKEGLISISSNYPEKYRELGLTHEIREHNEHTGENGCCLVCLKTELEDLEKTELDKKEYIQFRLGFFEDLVNYYDEKERAEYENNLLENLIQSKNYLIEVLSSI